MQWKTVCRIDVRKRSLCLIGNLLVSSILAGCVASNSTPFVVSQSPSSNANLTDSDTLTSAPSLPLNSPLFSFAKRFDEASLKKLPEVQALAATEAGLQAVKASKLPQILPDVNLAVANSESQYGVSAEQPIVTNGRVTARERSAEAEVKIAGAKLLVARNSEVLDGLLLFIEFSSLSETREVHLRRLNLLLDLERKLAARLAAGVSDRGELISLTTAKSETKRSIIHTESEMVRIQAQLSRRMDTLETIRPLESVLEEAQSCKMVWPKHQPTSVLVEKYTWEKARAELDLATARRWPQVILGVGISLTTGLRAGLSLNSSDMARGGRDNAIQIAEAKLASARLALMNETRLTQEKLRDHMLQADRSIKSISLLQAISEENERAYQLYEEQLASGAVQLTDAITLANEISLSETDLLETAVTLLSACLKFSDTSGTLIAN
jgi:outer membrane protein TolC